MMQVTSIMPSPPIHPNITHNNNGVREICGPEGPDPPPLVARGAPAALPRAPPLPPPAARPAPLPADRERRQPRQGLRRDARLQKPGRLPGGCRRDGQDREWMRVTRFDTCTGEAQDAACRVSPFPRRRRASGSSSPPRAPRTRATRSSWRPPT